MNTITIPRSIIRDDDLIVMPRREYEELLEVKKFKEFEPTKAEKLSLRRAEANFKKRKTLRYNDLIRKLGFTN